jgi:hypothetical protein
MEATATNLLGAYLREHGFEIKTSSFHAQVHTGIFWANLLPQGDSETDILIQIDGFPIGSKSIDVHDPKSFPEVIAHIVKVNAITTALKTLCEQLRMNSYDIEGDTFDARIHNGSFWMPIKLTGEVGLFEIGGVLYDMQRPIIGGPHATFEGLMKYLRECDMEAKAFMGKFR